MKTKNFILNLNEVGHTDLSVVGGKNASLGEMLQHLTGLGINIPAGFVLTVAAYKEFIEYNKLDKTIKDIINGIELDNIESLRRGGLQVRQLIKNGKFPEKIEKQIIEAYAVLSRTYDQEITDVAVRSSATAEDLPDASF